VPLVRAYLLSINVDVETQCAIGRYLSFISARASGGRRCGPTPDHTHTHTHTDGGTARAGQLVTPATWMRQFVHAHPKYQHDSVVSDEIAYDLVRACADLSEGRVAVPELEGSFNSPGATATAAAAAVAATLSL
jgi:glutamate--cysteine ligase catalytic subunit